MYFSNSTLAKFVLKMQFPEFFLKSRPKLGADRVQHTSLLTFLDPVELDVSFVSVSPEMLQVHAQNHSEADRHAGRTYEINPSGLIQPL